MLQYLKYCSVQAAMLKYCSVQATVIKNIAKTDSLQHWQQYRLRLTLVHCNLFFLFGSATFIN